jgi:hypothetical protein
MATRSHKHIIKEAVLITEAWGQKVAKQKYVFLILKKEKV